MKLRKERRKFNYFVAFGLILSVIAAVIFITKYYELRDRYYELLREQAVGINFKDAKIK